MFKLKSLSYPLFQKNATILLGLKKCKEVKPLPKSFETLSFIEKMGRLIDQYYTAPKTKKTVLLEEIKLLGKRIDPDFVYNVPGYKKTDTRK